MTTRQSRPARFADSVVLISGAARGMGAAHALGFIEEGAAVVLGDVLDEEGGATAADLGPRARYVHLDVTVESDWASAVSVAETEFGPVSVLVNNAGISGTPATVEDTTLDDWHRVLAVNLDGCFLGMRAVIPAMRRTGVGSIVNISSFAGFNGSPFAGAYTTSKFAIRGLTRVAAMELGAENIRVNSVHPGYIRTPMLEGLPDEVAHEKVALDRMAEAREVTELVLFVASAQASYCTGSEFVVDGGWTAGSPISIGASGRE